MVSASSWWRGWELGCLTWLITVSRRSQRCWSGRCCSKTNSDLNIAAFAVYVIGVALLTRQLDMHGLTRVGAATIIPFITASTDGLTKWLMSEEGGNLSRSELSFVRFLPASVVL